MEHFTGATLNRMSQETELKLAIDPRDAARLRSSPFLRASSLKHTRPQRLVSTYYDTPSLSLLRRTITLRIRKIGREHILSVKMASAETGALARRIELERSIRSNRPNLMQIQDLAIRQLIQECCADNDLVPLFATDVVRETWLLQLGRSQIECAIDRGIISARRRRAPVSEVELELKSGQPARLFQLARHLNTIVPLRIAPTSKAARGYDLVDEAGLTSPKAVPVQIDPAMSVRDSFAAIARACIAHVMASADYAYKSDAPESIHELRVSIRRMRAAFSVFRGAMPEKYKFRIGDELRTLQRKLGMARDWDVLVEDTIGRMPKRLRNQHCSESLIQIAQIKRAEGHKNAQAVLNDAQYTDLLLRLLSWIDGQFGSDAVRIPERIWTRDVIVGPAPRFACELMDVYHDKARKLGKDIHRLDIEKLHRLRIRIKKLRYATEFFGSLWPGRRAKRYLSALKELQQLLGKLQDTTVAKKLVMRLKTSGDADAKFSITSINHWLINCHRRDRKKAIELWGRFAKQKMFWESA